MGEEFYAIIKLVSGEEIISLVMVDENEGDPIIVLQNPVTMKAFHNQHGMHLKVKPWIEMSDDDFFMIRLDKVITMTETKDKKLINIYKDYITSDMTNESMQVNNSRGMVKLSSTMGYISSVEDARKKLENLFKDIKES